MGLKLSKRWLLVFIRWSVSFSHRCGKTRWIIIRFKDSRASLASSQRAWQHCESITHLGLAHPWVLALISVTSHSTKTFPAHPETSGLLLVAATPASPPSQGLCALPPQPRASAPGCSAVHAWVRPVGGGGGGGGEAFNAVITAS